MKAFQMYFDIYRHLFVIEAIEKGKRREIAAYENEKIANEKFNVLQSTKDESFLVNLD